VDSQPRVAIVTGASAGIGLAASVELARRGWSLVLVGRDRHRLDEALAQVRAAGSAPATAQRWDFAELDQVRAMAAALRDQYPRIDLLANNAGGTSARRQHTVDGFELTIQSNHLAPFLLSHLLRDRLAGGRIVDTASIAHRGGAVDPDDLNGDRRRWTVMGAYGSAKQANILFAAEAARRWPEILSTSYHPGTVRTRFGRDNPLISFSYRIAPFMRTPERGARTLVWLAEAPDIVNGAYYVDERARQPRPNAADAALAARLWDASLAAVGLS
jgi:NAD(P)-dependent dehydrogenase (short-subunit alcohol dehydrogenase family)